MHREWEYMTPHSLRKAFERALRNSGLDTKDQEFLMGHILPGSQDTYYDKTKVEDLRRKYAQVNFFPERAYSDENFRKRQVLDTAKLLGFPEDRIKRIEDALAKYEHVDEALEEIKKLSLGSYKEKDKGNIETNCNEEGNCGKHEIRIVQGEQKLIKFLGGNWNLVKELSNDRFVLKKGLD